MLSDKRSTYYFLFSGVGVCAGVVIMMLGWASFFMPCMFLPAAPILEFLESSTPKEFRWIFATYAWAVIVNSLFYAFVGGVIGHFVWRSHRLREESQLPRCRNCGYCLIGNTSGVCPECGLPL